jgi:hypothetical protein
MPSFLLVKDNLQQPLLNKIINIEALIDCCLRSKEQFFRYIHDKNKITNNMVDVGKKHGTVLEMELLEPQGFGR